MHAKGLCSQSSGKAFAAAVELSGRSWEARQTQNSEALFCTMNHSGRTARYLAAKSRCPRREQVSCWLWVACGVRLRITLRSTTIPRPGVSSKNDTKPTKSIQVGDSGSVTGSVFEHGSLRDADKDVKSLDECHQFAMTLPVARTILPAYPIRGSTKELSS